MSVLTEVFDGVHALARSLLAGWTAWVIADVINTNPDMDMDRLMFTIPAIAAASVTYIGVKGKGKQPRDPNPVTERDFED